MDPNFVCWSADDARATLKPLALEGRAAEYGDSLFLATHAPIEGFEVEGEAHRLSDRTDVALLKAFSDPETTHIACVVEGEPGAGKSHLIRWLKLRWPRDERDVVLLVERVDGSLEGTLRELQRNLPAAYQDLLAGVQPRSSLTVEGRATILLANLAAAMRPGVFEKSLDDEAWCIAKDVTTMLGASSVQKHWDAPHRVLQIVSGEKGEQRYSEVAQFVLADVVRLAEQQHNLLRDLRGQFKAAKFVRELGREADLYRERLEQGQSEQQLAVTAADSFPEALRLVSALNLRLNFAIQGLLGISGAALQTAFRRLRERLRKEGRRLVLLLEDVTSAQGVDQDLLQVVITSSATQPELCDQISVIGITPAYYLQYISSQGNIVQRLTQRVILGKKDRGDFQDVASLRDELAQLQFVARYLRVIRAGTSATHAAIVAGQLPPNHCETCPRSGECHKTFGEVERVGLYPLTKRTITRMFAELRAREGGMMLQTPRGMIQAVLAPTFESPDPLRSGEYPSDVVETAWHPKVEIQNRIVEGRVRTSGEPERLRRLVGWWGEPGTGATEPGSWAGLSPALVAAFGAPWLGDDGTVVNAPSPIPSNPPSTTDPPPKSDVPKPTRTSTTHATKGEGAATAKRARVPRRDRPAQLSQWLESRAIDDADSYWSGRILKILESLPWEQWGHSRWVVGATFTRENVVLQGAGLRRAQHFVVPAEAWVRDGLLAEYQLSELRHDLSPVEIEANLLQLSAFTAEMGERARAHLVGRLPLLEDGSPWSFIQALTQVLLARRWLRGDVRPLQPLVEQWEALLGADTGEASSAPGSRVESWKKALDAVRHAQAMDLPTALHEAVRRGDADSKTWIITDPSEAYAGMTALITSLRMGPRPPRNQVPKWSNGVLEKTHEYAEGLADLADIARREADRLMERAADILANLRGNSVRTHVDRLDRAVQRFAASLPQQHLREIQSWKAARAKIEADGLNGDPSTGRAQALQNFLIDAPTKDSAPPLEPAHAMTFAVSAPAADVATAFEQLRVGEKTVAQLGEFLRAYVASAGDGGASLADVQDYVKRLDEAVERLKGVAP